MNINIVGHTFINIVDFLLRICYYTLKELTINNMKYLLVKHFYVVSITFYMHILQILDFLIKNVMRFKYL